MTWLMNTFLGQSVTYHCYQRQHKLNSYVGYQGETVSCWDIQVIYYFLAIINMVLSILPLAL